MTVLSWLTGKAAAYVAGALLVAAIAAGAVAAVQSARAAAAVRERDAARADLQQARAAIGGKDETITALRAAVATWMALATPTEDVKAAAGRVESAAAALDRRARELARGEEADDARPDCAALLEVDLGGVCPGHARGVRERARGGLPRPAGAGPDPGRPADP